MACLYYVDLTQLFFSWWAQKGQCFTFKGIIHALEWWFSGSTSSNPYESWWFTMTGKSHLKIYVILIKSLNWILLSLIFTQRLHVCIINSAPAPDLSSMMTKSNSVLYILMQFPTFCGEVCLKFNTVSYHQSYRAHIIQYLSFGRKKWDLSCR